MPPGIETIATPARSAMSIAVSVGRHRPPANAATAATWWIAAQRRAMSSL
jgi:hypothetical protein